MDVAEVKPLGFGWNYDILLVIIWLLAIHIRVDSKLLLSEFYMDEELLLGAALKVFYLEILPLTLLISCPSSTIEYP